jgi:restriction system protein
MVPEEAIANILKAADPQLRQNLLRALRESLQVPDDQMPCGSNYCSRDIRTRYKIPGWTLRVYGVLITRQDGTELLQKFGYRPSRIDLSVRMSGKQYRYLFKREPVIDRRNHLYTYGEVVSLLRHKYRSLDTIGKDIIRTLGYADESPVYRPASNIIVRDISDEVLSHVQKHPEVLYVASPRTLEEICASIFRNHGFSADLTPPTKDGGYDIIAVKHNKLTGSEVYLVECKRYAPHRKVTLGVVRGLYGIVCSEDATKGIIITTSSFTRGAQEFAEKHSGRLSLRDFESLTDWLRELE